MNAATRTFYSALLLAAMVAAGLGAVTLRLLQFPHSEVWSFLEAIGHWCGHFLTSSQAVDELLLIGLLGLFPPAALLGLRTLLLQWRATRRLIEANLALRLDASPERVTELSQKLGLADRVDVVVVKTPYAFCYGWLTPRICVSSGALALLDDGELEALLLHERHHLRSRDPLKMLLAAALSKTFFFVPLIRELSGQFDLAKELAADQEVITTQGSRRCLAAALYKLVSHQPAHRNPAATSAMAGDAETRLDLLLNPECRPRLVSSLRSRIMAATILVAIAGLTASPQVLASPEHHGVAPGAAAGACPVTSPWFAL